jgi:hypothetical protein
LLWESIHNAIAREYGLFRLGDLDEDPFVGCQKFLFNSDTDAALDIIEMSLRVIDQVVRNWNPFQRQEARTKQDADDAIAEFNGRCKEHGLGYSFVLGQIVRVDSQYVHAEAVVPALTLLHTVDFKGPSDEFMKAHEHFRKGRHKEAIVEALKAFESTMKAICDRERWAYASTATAKDLIQILFNKNLIPISLQAQFASLRSLLESGVPTVRNKTSGHGQGIDPIDVPEHLAAYALHLTAANIVFLVTAHKA